MKNLLLFTFSFLLLAGGTVSAQTTMDLSTIDLGIQQIQQNTFLFDSINRDMALSSSARSAAAARGGRGAAGRNGRNGQPLVGPTTFHPVAASIIPQKLALEMGKTPAQRAGLEKMFADMLGDYKELARRRGAPLNDVARAASYLISQSVFVYNEGQLITAAEFSGLKDQMQRLFATDEQFRLLNDRERQEMYEDYAIRGTYLGEGYLLMKRTGDEETLNDLRHMARDSVQSLLGVPAERLKFTNNGVQIR